MLLEHVVVENQTDKVLSGLVQGAWADLRGLGLPGRFLGLKSSLNILLVLFVVRIGHFDQSVFARLGLELVSVLPVVGSLLPEPEQRVINKWSSQDCILLAKVLDGSVQVLAKVLQLGLIGSNFTNATPSIPSVVVSFAFDELDDVVFVVVGRDVGLVEHDIESLSSAGIHNPSLR